MKIVIKRKQILFLLGLFFTITTFGQTNKEKIVASFDKLDYYPDSTIKCAYRIKKELYNGYAVEFDSTGKAIFIGEYKKGKKNGQWNFSNGAKTWFKNGEGDLIATPGCGTGKNAAEVRFQELYLHLISEKRKN